MVIHFGDPFNLLRDLKLGLSLRMSCGKWCRQLNVWHVNDSISEGSGWLDQFELLLR
jgi:hypothetical protein